MTYLFKVQSVKNGIVTYRCFTEADTEQQAIEQVKFGNYAKGKWSAELIRKID